MYKKNFVDEEHYNKTKEMIKKAELKKEDYPKNACELSLFYILGSLDKFRRNPEIYYNFENGTINQKVFNEIPLSDTEEDLLRLAFHLFNSFNDFELVPGLKNLNRVRLYIALTAIKIRFGVFAL